MYSIKVVCYFHAAVLQVIMKKDTLFCQFNNIVFITLKLQFRLLYCRVYFVFAVCEFMKKNVMLESKKLTKYYLTKKMLSSRKILWLSLSL